MEPIYTHTTKLGPAMKHPADRGNPYMHRWHYSDGSFKDVIVGALKKAVVKS